MKKVVVVIVVLVVIAGVYVYQTPALRSYFSDLPAAVGVPKKSTSVYKWKNPEGVWQYTQEPPPEGVEYEVIEVTHDTNVLPLPDQLKHDD